MKNKNKWLLPHMNLFIIFSKGKKALSIQLYLAGCFAHWQKTKQNNTTSEESTCYSTFPLSFFYNNLKEYKVVFFDPSQNKFCEPFMTFFFANRKKWFMDLYMNKGKNMRGRGRDSCMQHYSEWKITNFVLVMIRSEATSLNISFFPFLFLPFSSFLPLHLFTLSSFFFFLSLVCNILLLLLKFKIKWLQEEL